MRDVEFDAFVEMLQSSVGRAQKLVADRHQGRLERLLQLDAEGRTEVLAWTFAVDDTASAADDARTIHLPLAVLRQQAVANVGEVVVEFEAAIGEVEAQTPTPPAVLGGTKADTVSSDADAHGTPNAVSPMRRLAVFLRRRWWPLRRPLHRIKIRLRGRQPGAGEVFVDDQLLKVLDVDGAGSNNANDSR